jgi:hypothetical protein
VAAIDPQSVRHHPLPQGLNANPQPMTLRQLLRRERGAEIHEVFGDPSQGPFAETSHRVGGCSARCGIDI